LLIPAARKVALDGGEDRLRDRSHRGHDVGHRLHGADRDPRHGEVVDVRGEARVFEVEARTEGASRAGEDHHPAGVVGADLLQRFVERQHQLERHGVEALRPIEADHLDVRPQLFDFDEGHDR
jgi:hypothetical protein